MSFIFSVFEALSIQSLPANTGGTSRQGVDVHGPGDHSSTGATLVPCHNAFGARFGQESKILTGYFFLGLARMEETNQHYTRIRTPRSIWSCSCPTAAENTSSTTRW